MDGRELSISQERYGDEIDLADIIKILYKNRKMIIIITTIVFLFGILGGAIHDIKRKVSYNGTLEFMYKPEKIDNSEDLKIYAFQIYMLNAILQKESLSEGLKGTTEYQVPSIVLGENTLAIREKDMGLYRNNYRLNVNSNNKEVVEKEIFSYYENIKKESEALGYNSGNFIKLKSDITKEVKPKKIYLFSLIGLFIGLFFSIFAAFGKEFFKGMDFKK